MGDRANFGFKQNNGHTVFLYAHWGGYEMLSNFAHALDSMRKVHRINDDAYGTLIGIRQMTQDHNGDTGYGITVDEIADNQHSIPVFDFDSQTVSLYDGKDEDAIDGVDPKFTMPVDAFIAKFYKAGSDERR